MWYNYTYLAYDSSYLDGSVPLEKKKINVYVNEYIQNAILLEILV